MENTTSATGQGRGKLFYDAKLGNLWNSVVAAAIYAVIGWIKDFDWTSFPTWAGQIGVPVGGLIVGWLTSRALPHKA